MDGYRHSLNCKQQKTYCLSSVFHSLPFTIDQTKTLNHANISRLRDDKSSIASYGMPFSRCQTNSVSEFDAVNLYKQAPKPIGTRLSIENTFKYIPSRLFASLQMTAIILNQNDRNRGRHFESKLIACYDAISRAACCVSVFNEY